MKLVVVGLGSELMGDDAAGLMVVDMLSKEFEGSADFRKCLSTGFGVMESIEGYDRAIIVDTICTGRYKIGEIVRIRPEEIQYSKRIASFHDFDLLMSVELGRRLGLKMPSDIKIYGIEIKESTEFSENISDEVWPAITSLAGIISEDIERFRVEKRHNGGLNGGTIDG